MNIHTHTHTQREREREIEREREREAHAHDSCIIMYHLNSCMSPDSPCCCREHYHTDQVIPKELIAFSDPSPSGRKFAESYVGMQHFLVYQWFS